jgi:hypothetical protein
VIRGVDRRPYWRLKWWFRHSLLIRHWKWWFWFLNCAQTGWFRVSWQGLIWLHYLFFLANWVILVASLLINVLIFWINYNSTNLRRRLSHWCLVYNSDEIILTSFNLYRIPKTSIWLLNKALIAGPTTLSSSTAPSARSPIWHLFDLYKRLLVHIHISFSYLIRLKFFFRLVFLSYYGFTTQRFNRHVYGFIYIQFFDFFLHLIIFYIPCYRLFLLVSFNPRWVSLCWNLVSFELLGPINCWCWW